MFVESEPNVLQSRSILHSFDENKSGVYMNNEYKAIKCQSNDVVDQAYVGSYVPFENAT